VPTVSERDVNAEVRIRQEKRIGKPTKGSDGYFRSSHVNSAERAVWSFGAVDHVRKLNWFFNLVSFGNVQRQHPCASGHFAE
jgi:hypothetical protein